MKLRDTCIVWDSDPDGRMRRSEAPVLVTVRRFNAKGQCPEYVALFDKGGYTSDAGAPWAYWKSASIQDVLFFFWYLTHEVKLDPDIVTREFVKIDEFKQWLETHSPLARAEDYTNTTAKRSKRPKF